VRKVVPGNKKLMNVKAETIGTGKASDTGLLILAVLIVIAGVAGYYLFPGLAPTVRTLMVLAGIVIGCGVAWFTRPGRGVRGFLRETQFELRKVVWPTRQETIRTTLVVIVIAVILAILLGLIDLFLRWAILDNLLKL
jgi:preprotein translocase subunit SecE